MIFEGKWYKYEEGGVTSESEAYGIVCKCVCVCRWFMCDFVCETLCEEGVQYGDKRENFVNFQPKSVMLFDDRR